MKVGKNIATLRTQRGLKANFVAEKIGIKAGLLSAIERERSNPTIEQIVALSDFFGVTTDYLLKGANNESNNATFA